MAKKSEQTQKYIILECLMWLLSFMSVVLPLAIPIISSYFNHEIETSEKLVLTFTVVIALVLTVFNVLGKAKLRSPFFILLIGLYYALTTEGLIDTLTTVTVFVILDELIFTPFYKHYKNKRIINQEMDKRLQ